MEDIKNLIEDNIDKDYVIIVHNRETWEKIYKCIIELKSKFNITFQDPHHEKLIMIDNNFDKAVVFRHNEYYQNMYTYTSDTISLKFWSKYYPVLDINENNEIFVLGDDLSKYNLDGYLAIANKDDKHVIRYIGRTHRATHVYCNGYNCQYKDTCLYHIVSVSNNSRFSTLNKEYHDYSTEGSGSASNNKCEVTYTCGDNNPKYPMYMPISKEYQIPEIPKEHKTIETRIQLRRLDQMKNEFCTAVKCTNCGSHGIEYELDENNYLKIHCTWCGCTSRIKLDENNSILKDQKYKMLWNNFKKYFKDQARISRNNLSCSVNVSDISHAIAMLEKEIFKTENED